MHKVLLYCDIRQAEQMTCRYIILKSIDTMEAREWGLSGDTHTPLSVQHLGRTPKVCVNTIYSDIYCLYTDRYFNLPDYIRAKNLKHCIRWTELAADSPALCSWFFLFCLKL